MLTSLLKQSPLFQLHIYVGPDFLHIRQPKYLMNAEALMKKQLTSSKEIYKCKSNVPLLVKCILFGKFSYFLLTYNEFIILTYYF